MNIEAKLRAALTAAVICAPNLLSRADVILDWNNNSLNAIRTARVTPQFASRNLAMVHAAMYDAVSAVDKTHAPYHSRPLAPSDTSREAAAATAGYLVLASLYPAQQGTLSNLWVASLAAVPDGTPKSNGIALGEATANDIIALRVGDGSTNVVAYVVTNTPGRWRPTPPANAPAQLPQWPFVKTFGLPRADLFRPAGPVALTSSQWTFDFNQVKSLGDTNSTTRTADQTEIARFWLDGAGTWTPPGHWNAAAQAAAISRGNTLSQNARLFALLNLCMADAAIAAWDAKFNTFPFWRPITAIREADTDGNPDTVADPNWTPLTTTPPHPDYVSGHATFSGAAARVLADLFGNDAIPFVVGSDDLPGVTRRFGGFADCMREIGMSRIYAGIHTMTTIVDGFALGRSVANYFGRNFLLPVSAAPTFGASQRRPDGHFETLLSGAAGDSYVVESTDDFLSWDVHSTVTAPATVEDAATTSVPSRFFRAYRPNQGF
ncbi:MAG: phosphatase PAP2 family protein [Verrucomicrobiales bacterium]|nr:phosphatase PAP2 family protein [Verrucomicrobiales bacterium]